MTTTTLNVVTTPKVKAPRVPLTTTQRLEIAFRSLDAIKTQDVATLQALLATMQALKASRAADKAAEIARLEADLAAIQALKVA